uniref:DNA primase n=1 Tax=Strigamia maritima TaxID=126957 RepID=T1JEJ4_STRMM
MTTESNEELSRQEIETLLPTYYQRLFPFQMFYKWLSYGNIQKNYFMNREFSFTLQEEIYLRYQSFSNVEEFKKKVIEKNPVKMDIGAVYSARPKDHKTVIGFQPVEKELVFDIDMSDYNDVRFCCTKAAICQKCWPLMVFAVKILDKALRGMFYLDFGFNRLLWVYSGRRGIHCWVCDEKARQLSKSVRHSIVDYLTLLLGGDMQAKKVNLNLPIHESVRRALDIIKRNFDSFAIENQDFLGDQEKIEKLLRLIKDEKMKTDIRNDLKHCSTSSAEKWGAIQNCFTKTNIKNFKAKKNFGIEEIMIQYCYPRLDSHVTIGLNHLLKSPFCVHPKTACVCVPFLASQVDSFDPLKVPTLKQLIDEINKNGAASESQEEKLKAYKETSLNQYIEIFKSFLEELAADQHAKKLEESDKKRIFKF